MQHIKRIDPTSIFTVDRDGLNPQYGEQLTTNAEYRFEIGGDQTPQNTRILVLEINQLKNNEFTKKKLAGIEPYIHVLSKINQASGRLSSGSFVFPYGIQFTNNLNFIGWLPMTKTSSREYLIGGYFNNFTLNAYNKISLSESSKIEEAFELNNFYVTIPVGAMMTGSLYYGEEYTGHAQLVVLSDVNKPYLDLIYEDVVPRADNVYPASGFVNEKVDNTFGWTFAYDVANIAGVLKQTSAVFRWRGTDEVVHEIAVGEEQNVTIPANTFDGDTIEWQVVVTSDDGVQSVPDKWYKLTTIDSISTARAEYPNQVVIDGLSDNYFSWMHVIDTGSPQSKYDLQYSQNGETWIDIKSEVTEETDTIIPDGTLPKGNILWRVRTYNSDGVVGTWSEPAQIVVRSRPDAPAISSFTDTPRPTVNWQSKEQQAYEIKTDSFESGLIFGMEKQYKIPSFLDDGNHLLQVRIVDQYGTKSDWSSVVVNIRNISEGEVILSSSGGTHAKLIWTGNYQKYVVYRDGEKIAETDKNTFTDYLGTGKHLYQVRGFTKADNYSLSNVLYEIAKSKYDIIAEVGVFDFISLKYTKEDTAKEHAEKVQIAYNHYSGKTLPEATITEFKDASHSFEYRFKRNDLSYEKIKELQGKLVVWKNKDQVIVGTLGQVNIRRARVIDISFSITEVDHETD